MPRGRTIPEHQRGRKPCLSSEGPLVPYSLKVSISMRAWCKEQGQKKIRKYLEDMREKDQKSEPKKVNSNPFK